MDSRVWADSFFWIIGDCPLQPMMSWIQTCAGSHKWAKGGVHVPANTRGRSAPPIGSNLAQTHAWGIAFRGRLEHNGSASRLDLGEGEPPWQTHSWI
jgi:hypothetical protein